ncbi:MAG: protein-arginine deiminase family protein, partial [Myxococcota bacterium]
MAGRRAGVGAGSNTVTIGGQPVLRRGDPAVRGEGRYVDGHPTVRIDGRPLVTEGHPTDEGDRLSEGSSSVNTGPGQSEPAEGAAYVRFHIHVDANRDGQVDDSWEHNGEWRGGADGFGAVVMVNSDDDASPYFPFGETVVLPDEPPSLDLAKPGRVITGADAADVAPLVLRRDPITAGQSEAGWSLRLFVDRPSVLRIFDGNSEGATELIGPETNAGYTFFDLAEDEITLSMEALRYPGPDPNTGEDSFDGRATITLEMYAPSGTLDHTESAVVRVAPWIVFSHFDPTQAVLAYSPRDLQGLVIERRDSLDPTDVRSFLESFVPSHERFLAELNLALPAGLSSTNLSNFANPGDPWIQDVLESGHCGMAGEGARMTVCHGQGDERERFRFADGLVSPDVGLIRSVPRGRPTQTFDNFGNVECTPPLRNRAGELTYPYGRIVFGENNQGRHLAPALLQDTRRLFEAQGLQSPIALPTGWLGVGHIDEAISFLPMRDAPLGFRVLVASPALAYELFAEMVAQGRGAERILGGLAGVEDPLFAGRNAFTAEEYLTLGGEFEVMRATTDGVEGYLEEIQGPLISALGLSGSDFIPLPVVFHSDLNGGSPRYCGAFTPNVVNSLIVTQGAAELDVPKSVTMVAAKTAPAAAVGADLDGSSYFDTYIKQVLEQGGRSGVTVKFIDAFESFHVNHGEVHCATNSLRHAP